MNHPRPARQVSSDFLSLISPMKTLLPLNHPTYLRRLARELNSLPDGFYQGGTRYNRARFTLGSLVVIGETLEWNHRKRRTAMFSDTAGITFSDAYGRSVCASRRA